MPVLGMLLKTILVYYGFPSLINNAAYNLQSAVQTFSKYDYVVLGADLENSTHADHSNTKQIIANLTSTKVFGYVTIGVYSAYDTANNYKRNLSLATLETYIEEWKNMSVAGIFLDEYGFDYYVDRARQNAVVDLIHAAGLLVIANAWNVDDVFGTAQNPDRNPNGVASHLSKNDFYFYESLQIAAGVLVTEQVWQNKTKALFAYQKQPGIKVLAVTTNNEANAFNQVYFEYAYYSALMYGYEAFGWSEYQYSSCCVSANMATFHQQPQVNVGRKFTTDRIEVDDHEYSRATDRGEVTVQCVYGGFNREF